MSNKIKEESSCYRCFICWDDIDFEDNSTKIVSACSCISTDFKYTHKECLNLWINQNRRAGLKCQVCGTPFHVKKVLKPLKRIYLENWKKINVLFLIMFLINSLIWMTCIQWSRELERMNSGYNSEISSLDSFEAINKYNDWLNAFDERENYFEEYIGEFNFDGFYQNIYFNSTTLLLFINATILVLFVYHEKDNFIEYSIDEIYEYKSHSLSPSKSKFFILSNNQNMNDDHFNENRNIYNNYEYQKIRVI